RRKEIDRHADEAESQRPAPEGARVRASGVLAVAGPALVLALAASRARGCAWAAPRAGARLLRRRVLRGRFLARRALGRLAAGVSGACRLFLAARHVRPPPRAPRRPCRRPLSC